MGPPGSRRPLYRGRTLLGLMKSTGERRSKAVGGTHSIYSEILHLPTVSMIFDKKTD